MTIRGKRIERCPACRLPRGACVCALLVPRPARTRIVVLMHPKERTKTSNTGALAARMLAGARVVLHGDHDALADALALAGGSAGVLFPDDGAQELAPGPTAPSLLVVPDGTWRQSRRMARRTPALDALPRYRLPQAGPSRYRLREASSPERLCTLEAIAGALGILEEPELEEALLAVLSTVVARTLAARGLPA